MCVCLCQKGVFGGAVDRMSLVYISYTAITFLYIHNKVLAFRAVCARSHSFHLTL